MNTDKEFTATMLQKATSVEVKVISFGGQMAICCNDDGPVLITKEQAIDFFDLVDPNGKSDELSNTKLSKGEYVVVQDRLGTPDRSYLGEFFQIEVVDLPFVRLKRLKGFFKGKVITLDVRETVFKKCSPEFITNVLANNN